MQVDEVRRLRELEAENARLKRAFWRESALESTPSERCSGENVGAPARRQAVRALVEHGFADDTCLRGCGISRSSFHYESRRTDAVELLERSRRSGRRSRGGAISVSMPS